LRRWGKKRPPGALSEKGTRRKHPIKPKNISRRGRVPVMGVPGEG